MAKEQLFWFILPLHEVIEQPESHQNSKIDDFSLKPGKSLNLLVAEDNLINAKVITTFLEDEMHNVTLVSSGEAALTKLADDKYDMVFMDMRMPIINGPEATKKWRQIETDGVYTPIIAFTANASPADRQLCIDSGMDDFLIKPVSPEQLNNVIQKYT